MPAASEPADHRPRLDRATITRAAVELLDEVGLAELSTRRLAARLGVRSPTLYWHVRDKEELLDLVAEAICADAFEIDEAAPWRDRLRAGLRQFRALLLAHRDAAALLRRRPPTGPHRLGHVETTVRILVEAGLPDAEAAATAQILAAHVLNSVETVVPDRSGDVPDLTGFPELSRIAPAYAELTGEDLYELGCELLLDGLAHRIAPATGPRPS